MRLPFAAAAIVALSLIACNGAKEPTPEVGPVNTLIETAGYTGVVISVDGASEFSYLFAQATTEFWEPSIHDVSRAESCSKRFLASVTSDPNLDAYQKEKLSFILDNLESYRRQYVGTIVDGEKRIWCNSFFSAESFPNWERVPVDVDGGGNRFWQIEYNLPKDECINFNVHGES
jgi:hypothetical protein